MYRTDETSVTNGSNGDGAAGMAAAFNPMMTQFYAMQQMEAAREKQELRAQINELKSQSMVKGPAGPYGGGGAGPYGGGRRQAV